MVPWGKGQKEGINREFENDMYTAVFKMDNRQDPTYCVAQGTLLKVMWQAGWEGNLGENGFIYVYGWVPLLCT